MTFAGVVNGKSMVTEGGQERLEARYDVADGADIVALALEVAFRRADLALLVLCGVNGKAKKQQAQRKEEEK